MTKTRWLAAVAALAVLAAGGGAYAVTSSGGDGDRRASSAAPSTTTSAKPTTTTTAAPTTTTTAAPTTTVPAPDDVLEQGESGDAVKRVQARLTELKFDPGPADGAFGQATTYAVQGFQKLNGMAPDGQVGPKVLAALENPAPVVPLVPDGGADRVEVDLQRQLLFLYKGGELRLVSHVSTGSGERYCAEGDCGNRAITPVGGFRFSWRYDGWRQSRLGKLYNPVYFTSSGVAVHGALSVPTYPASHGCVRIPMHIAEYFPSLVKRGDGVYVTDGRRLSPNTTAPSGPPPSDPPTTPGGDPATTTTSTTAPPPATTTTTTPPPTTTSTTAPPPTTTPPPTLLP